MLGSKLHGTVFEKHTYLQQFRLMKFAAAAVDLIQTGKIATYGADAHLLRQTPLTQAALRAGAIGAANDAGWQMRQFRLAREMIVSAQNDEHMSAVLRRQLIGNDPDPSTIALIDALFHAAQLPVRSLIYKTTAEADDRHDALPNEPTATDAAISL